jgi:hypothetical protein
MIFHKFNSKTQQMFIVTPSDGVPIEHLKRIVDHYYKFKDKGTKDVFSKETLVPLPLSPDSCSS